VPVLLAQTYGEPAAQAGAVVFGLIFIAIVFSIVLLPLFFIVKKAGYSPWWTLVIFVPLLDIVAIYLFAFLDWPVLRAARGEGGAMPSPMFPNTPPPPFTGFGGATDTAWGAPPPAPPPPGGAGGPPAPYGAPPPPPSGGSAFPPGRPPGSPPSPWS